MDDISNTSDSAINRDDRDSLQTEASSRSNFTFMDSGAYKMMESTDELYFLSLIAENKNILCSRCNTPEFKYSRVSIWDSITRQLSKKLGRPLLSEKVQRRWNNIQQRMKTNFSKQLTRFTDLYGQIDPETITLDSLSLSKNDKYVLEILGFENVKHALCFPTNALRNTNPILEARLQEQSTSPSSSTSVIKIEDSPIVICGDTYQSSNSSKPNDGDSQPTPATYSRSHVPASYTDSQRLSQLNNHRGDESTGAFPQQSHIMRTSDQLLLDQTYPIRNDSIINDKRRSCQFNFSPTTTQLLNSRDICTFEELDIMRKKLEIKKLQLEVDNLELEKERRKLEIEVLRRQLQSDDCSGPVSKRFRNS